MKKVLSYGGGLDSFAMLLDALARGEKPDVVVFMDVGDGDVARDGEDPGEWPGTYRHIREIVIPMCLANEVMFVWLNTASYPVRDARSLFAWLQARSQIPVSGPNRICTTIAKVERFERWLADTFPGQPVEVWIGFEAGEDVRADKDPNAGKGKSVQRQNRFPLIERQLCRCRCKALVERLGYPVPRKSACVYCPYGTARDWKTFARELPVQFEQVVALEADKPPTKKNGIKLSIMGYDSKKKQGTPLPIYVARPERKPRPKPCLVCGAAERATKATGCDYLSETAA